eukprot:scaffold221_cov249-Pinguiococcus_pyrenoidosus.AAC.8
MTLDDIRQAREIHRRSIPPALLAVLYQVCEEEANARPASFSDVLRDGFPEDVRWMSSLGDKRW